nr:hypothetical protein [Mycobacterium tuberculosis]
MGPNVSLVGPRTAERVLEFQELETSERTHFEGFRRMGPNVSLVGPRTAERVLEFQELETSERTHFERHDWMPPLDSSGPTTPDLAEARM